MVVDLLNASSWNQDGACQGPSALLVVCQRSLRQPTAFGATATAY